MGMIEQAMMISARVHEDQLDKSGKPYVFHPMRVAVELLKSTGDHELVAAALLHDVLEDTSVTAEELLGAGMTERTIGLVQAVSRQEGELCRDFILRITKHSEAAILLKIADIGDNSLPERMGGISMSLIERYQKAKGFLGEVLAAARRG